MSGQGRSLWEALWDYDPNALVAVDPELNVKVVNPAFCRMFHVSREDIVGKQITEWMEDANQFVDIWRTEGVIRGREKHYERFGLYVKQIMFTIPDENIIACIMVDITPEKRQQQELLELKRETLLNVKQVVDKQMSVAQEIASLLGETTAETKASLLRLARMVEEEGRND